MVTVETETLRNEGPFSYPASRGFLFICAALAIAIGGSILFSPHAFFATNNVTLNNDPNLLSEIRAPGGLLIAAGLMMMAGAVFKQYLISALRVAAIAFTAYGLARCISWTVDGAPSLSLIIALALEIGLGVIAASYWQESITRIRTDVQRARRSEFEIKRSRFPWAPPRAGFSSPRAVLAIPGTAFGTKQNPPQHRATHPTDHMDT